MDREQPEQPLSIEHEILVRRVLSELRKVGDSRFKQAAVLRRFADQAARPVGLPTIKARFDHPERTDRENKEYRRAWVRQHAATIQANLRPGHIPYALGGDVFSEHSVVVIPIEHNIVTDRFAQKLLRDVVCPSTSNPMIEQFGASGESKYKYMAVNAMGVGTNDAAEAVGDTQLGAGTSPKNQWCWFHANTGASLGAALDDDLVLSTNYGVDAYAIDSLGTVTSIFLASASAKFTLTYPTDASPNFEAQYAGTWPFGTDGDERYGNFGSDASPNEWREIGLANAAMTGTGASDVKPAGAHPDKAFHLATRKKLAGTGFAKTSGVELTNEYKLRWTSG